MWRPEHSQSSFVLSPTQRVRGLSQMLWWRKHQKMLRCKSWQTTERLRKDRPHPPPVWGGAQLSHGPWSLGDGVELLRSAFPSFPPTSVAEMEMGWEILCHDPLLPRNSVHSTANPVGSSLFSHGFIYCLVPVYSWFFIGWLAFLASVLGGGKEDLMIFKTKRLTLISISTTVFELMFPSSLESSIHQYWYFGCFFILLLLLFMGFVFALLT